MPDRLFRFYQRRRVVNINANIVISGLLSTAIVMVLLWLIKDVFNLGWATWGYTAFSAVADLILDVGTFASLHWVANHWRPLQGGSERERFELSAPAPNPVRDATQLQFERAVISPLYYIIAVAGTEALQQQGLHAAWAVGIAYPSGLAVTRTIHTIWGLRSGSYTDHHRRDNGDGGSPAGPKLVDDRPPNSPSDAA
ncbi:MAG: hypothetical protein AAGF47_04120 [Planctomycetota bacterium]